MKNEISKKMYITLDIDWAIDPVIQYCLDLFEELGIQTTINVTHATELMDIMSKKHELGIHPNFNFLLSGEADKESNYSKVISSLKNLVPDAVTVRSHACVSGSQLKYEFVKSGLKYELNTMIIPSKGQYIKPWCLAGVWQIPYIFEDDVYFGNENHASEYWFDEGWEMPRVMNFHPIHIFLNTESMERYNTSRPYLKDIDKLNKCRNMDNYGTEKMLRKLVSDGKTLGYTFETIRRLGENLE